MNTDQFALISRLYAVWLAHPDLRLGQLIAMAGEPLSRVDDMTLIERIEHAARCYDTQRAWFTRDAALRNLPRDF